MKWSRQAVADGQVQAVVMSSGGANACTGQDGYADAALSAARIAGLLSLPIDNVAICSTGLIGLRLPMPAVLSGIELAVAKLSIDSSEAAQAILTTDTVTKLAKTQRNGWRVGAMAKGAGTLVPGLATMLAIITTDSSVSAEVLERALKEAIRITFNRADSDGCMSTNDTVLALASGASGETPNEDELCSALREVSADLTRQLIENAEGASHVIALEVIGAANEHDAELVVREIARSNLFKCAIFGEHPNWGRVLSALGVAEPNSHLTN